LPDDPVANGNPSIEVTEAPENRIEVAQSGVRTVSDELVRAALALLFSAIFLLTIILSFVHLSTADWTDTKEWLQALLPAETALIGSATGFYFGQKKSN